MHRADRHLLALRGLIASAATNNTPFLAGPAARDPHISKASALDIWVMPLLASPPKKGVLFVAAAVGSKSDIKKWPVEYYSKLLDRLIQENDCRVILIGDESDAKDCAKVKQGMRQPVTDLCGKTNFRELCAILLEANLLITNDSAPLHIADALGIPTLAIFGPTDPRKYGPRLGASQVVKKDVFCSPCERAQCRYDHECMKDLSVGEVYQRARRILNGDSHPTNSNILIVRLDRIGDLMLSLPAIHAIREQFPNARVSLMVRSYLKELVEGNPDIDEVIPYHYEKKGRHRFFLGYFRFIREMRKRRFDKAFILHPSTRSHLLPFLAGIPERVGFDSQLSFLLTKKIPDLRNEGKKHESEYTLDIVTGASHLRCLAPQVPGTFGDRHFEVTVYQDESPGNFDFSFIAIHPGASCPSKRWPKERFAVLAKKIIEELPHRLVIVGGEEEKREGQYLKQELGDRVADLTGQLKLKELAAVLQKAELLITNDSGPGHIAAAVGTPTLTIFGRNQAGLSARRWKTLGDHDVVIQKDVGCVVCLAHRCTIDFECLKAVEVEEVYCVLKNMIGVQSGKF